ncbi:MAG: (2Fe-2S) ferredoxin domain-containing protein [Rhodospirillaceae bacterium]|nr:(2Fe-2S) ferredoxin domain-containing protein [Rhodospirillaceae bacterium]
MTTPETDNKTDNKLVYDVHVFCCINEREPDHPRGSCSARGSVDLHQYMKVRSKELKLKAIRINKAGCLIRCELGPVLVIYPQAVWYHFNSREDVDEIIDRHIIGGETVERLILESDQKLPTP